MQKVDKLCKGDQCMGRYTEYFNEIWKLRANRKVIGLSIFGAVLDNTTPFTPGNQLKLIDGADLALQMLIQKGYDFLFITGQPPHRTKNLENHDFENILEAIREIVGSMGGSVKYAYYAPGTDKNDPYVKPNPGMFERAQNENMVTWSDSIFVGVEPNDVKAALKVKATPVIITGGKDIKLKALELTHNVKVQEFNTLLDLANSL